MSRKPEVEMSNDIGDTVEALVGSNTWGWVLAFGVLTLAAGIAVLAWPAETLLVIAVLFGIQLVITGIFRFVLAFTEPIRGAGIRVLYAVIGLLSLIVGVWAIRHADLTVLVFAGLIVVAVPQISVVTLAVVLGIWLLFWGIGEIMIAFRLRSAARGQLGPGQGRARVSPWRRDAS